MGLSGCRPEAGPAQSRKPKARGARAPARPGIHGAPWASDIL